MEDDALQSRRSGEDGRRNGSVASYVAADETEVPATLEREPNQVPTSAVPIAIKRKQKSGSETDADHAAASSPKGSLYQASTMGERNGNAAGDDGASISNGSVRSQQSVSSSSTATRTYAEDLLKRTSSPKTISDRATTQLSDVMASPVLPSSSAPIRPSSAMGSSSQGRDKNAKLASMIKRNYIYFTSLLQEPEAKWKHFSDSRGVTITQLDSIDPTLVVYRAEATFVGVGIWDLFAAVTSPGVKNAWDRGVEQGQLLQDLGDASKLWWNKIRATWPVAPRDSVVVETAYKSPNSIHVFSFSTDDRQLFPSIQAPEPGAIRTQIDLRGWSIESLSPTTAHITLIEQSDPKGWTSKASATPAAMTAAVAGIGDFAIKQGAPPITTKLRGARLKSVRYEYDKALTRLEYDLSVPVKQKVEDTKSGNVECEIRCEVEKWSPSLDVIVDPPPLNVRCIRRHKLSPGGGGLWVTIEQASASLEDDCSRITVRKASNKEKGVVYVNGAKMKTEVEELKEEEAAQLRDQKRTKPRRTPLDLVTDSPKKPLIGSNPHSTPVSRTGTPANGTSAITTASSNLAAVTSAASNSASSQTRNVPRNSTEGDVFSDERPRKPMTCALDVLFLLRRIHAERSPDPAGNPAGWSLVSQRSGLFVRRRLMQSISPTVMIQRSDKVVEGLTAESILAVVSNLSCRRIWDDKVESARLLESYGSGASTGFFTTKASFPFRGRGFHVASLTARSGPGNTQFSSANPSSAPTVFFYASCSYPERNVAFSSSKLNPTALPIGKVLIDGWIMETLDPYSSTLNYQIPSTRVTHLIAIDYAGSLPVTVNAMWNTQLTRSIGLVEEYLKSKGSLPEIRRPPFCVEVLGDGRDDDHDLVWSLSDETNKRASTLLSKEFDPSSKRYNMMCLLNSQGEKMPAEEEVRTPLAMPFPLRAAVPSNASTTRGLASAATLTPSSSKDSLSSFGIQPNSEDRNLENSVTRTTSMNSVRSTASKSRPSVIRKEAKKPTDLVIVDLEVELRYYEKGYRVEIACELGANDLENDVKAAEKKGNEDKTEEDVEPIVTKKIDVEKGLPDQIEFPSQKTQDLPHSSSSFLWSLQAASSGSAKEDLTLPFQVSAFDMPPSAVLAATLDPSARPKKHLLRIGLPTAAFVESARENPFFGPEPDEAPQWFTNLRRRGAVVRVTVSPYDDDSIASITANPPTDIASVGIPTASGASTPTSHHSAQSGDGEMDSQQVPVYYRNERINVTHVNKTSAMLQRESESEQVHAVLKRIAVPLSPRIGDEGVMSGESHRRSTSSSSSSTIEDGLPVLLSRPMASAEVFRADAEVKPDAKADARQKGEAHKGSDSLLSPSSSGEVGDLTMTNTNKGDTPRVQLNVPEASTPKSSGGASAAATSSPTSAASAQIMSILNAYPLSRLGGASTAVSTTVANGGVFSRKGVDVQDDGALASKGELDENKDAGLSGVGATGVGGEEEGLAGVPGQLIEATEQIRKRLTDVKFNLSTLILVALIAFLLGSLVRSLLEPADFVLVKSLTGEAASAQQSAESGLQAVAVREIKRMFDGQDDGGLGLQHGHEHGSSAGGNVAWRELRRLVEVRNMFGGRWDFVIAAVRR